MKWPDRALTAARLNRACERTECFHNICPSYRVFQFSAPHRFKRPNILKTIFTWMETLKTNIPDTCRNSPVLWPYRLTECSKAFLSVEPFSCARSKVPPKGKTEIRSSMVIEPTDETSTRFSKALTKHKLTGNTWVVFESSFLWREGHCWREKTHSSVCFLALDVKSCYGLFKWRTVSALLIDRRANASSIIHGGTNVVPLDVVRESDVVVDLKKENKKQKPVFIF